MLTIFPNLFASKKPQNIPKNHRYISVLLKVSHKIGWDIFDLDLVLKYYAYNCALFWGQILKAIVIHPSDSPYVRIKFLKQKQKESTSMLINVF